MTYLLVGDLHQTANARDAYRFGIFPWLLAQQQKLKPEITYLLGDLTDKKDHHPSTLVNQIVDGLRKLQPPVVVVGGNHDWFDPESPFFRFLNYIEGLTFVNKPLTIGGDAIIPHMRDEEAFIAACNFIAKVMSKPDIILTHNTFQGAISETGVTLQGFKLTPIKRLAPRYGAYAGDVHKPQESGPLTYVGAPYHIRFGDDFEPRVLFISKEGECLDLHFPAPKKWALTINQVTDLTRNKLLSKGDQIKVTMELDASEAVEWKAKRTAVVEACKKRGLEVFGLDVRLSGSKPVVQDQKALGAAQPSKVFTAFCKAEKVPPAFQEVGKVLLDTGGQK